MAEQQRTGSSMVEGSITAIIGAVIAAVVLIVFTAIWTGTISGPTNPAFWQQLAPFLVLLALGLLLGVAAMRRLVFDTFKLLLKKPAMWVFGLRATTERRRNGLVDEGGREALAEVAKRNSEPEAFNITYLTESPIKGVDWFLLTDFSGISGTGPMKDIRITGPKDEIVMEDNDGLTIPGKDPKDRYRFSGRVTDRGHQKGIDFRIFWRDSDGYPRWDFHHVPPSGQPLKGVRAGSFGDINYGELFTSPNMNDQSLTVKWVSTEQVMGRLVPSGRVWQVELGRREGQIRANFIVEDGLGTAETPAEGIELLRLRALQENSDRG